MTKLENYLVNYLQEKGLQKNNFAKYYTHCLTTSLYKPFEHYITSTLNGEYPEIYNDKVITSLLREENLKIEQVANSVYDILSSKNCTDINIKYFTEWNGDCPGYPGLYVFQFIILFNVKY